MLSRLASVSPLHAKELCINLHLCNHKQEGDTVTKATSLPSTLLATRSLSVTRGSLPPISKETEWLTKKLKDWQPWSPAITRFLHSNTLSFSCHVLYSCLRPSLEKQIHKVRGLFSAERNFFFPSMNTFAFQSGSPSLLSLLKCFPLDYWGKVLKSVYHLLTPAAPTFRLITASISTITDKDPLLLFPLQSLISILAKGLKFGGKISFYQNPAYKLSEKQWNGMFGGGFLSWFISLQSHYRSCRSRKSKDAGSDCSIYISIAHTQLSLQEPSSKLTMWTDAFDNW